MYISQVTAFSLRRLSTRHSYFSGRLLEEEENYPRVRNKVLPTYALATKSLFMVFETCCSSAKICSVENLFMIFLSP